MAHPKTDPNKELSREDIRTAIESSGYPFEMKLYKQFAGAGFQATIGFQAAIGEPGKVREIDLTAGVTEVVQAGGRTGAVQLQAFIAAKKLHAPGRFVGIEGPQVDGHTQSEARARRIDGTPAFGVTFAPGDSLRDIVQGPGGFADALTPLVQRTTCAHWAIANRKQDGRPWAAGDRPFWEDFDTLVRATVAVSAGTSLALLDHDLGHVPEMRLLVPTVIVDTDHLVTYSTESGEVQEVDWLILDRTFDVGGANPVRRLVDVVSARGVASMIERYRDAASRLRAVLEENCERLSDCSHKQRVWWAEKGRLMPVATFVI